MATWYGAGAYTDAHAGAYESANAGAGVAVGAGVSAAAALDAEMFAWLSQHSLFVRVRLEDADFPKELGPLLEIMYPGQQYRNDDKLRDLRAAFEHPPRIPLLDLWISAPDNPRRLQPPSAVFALMDEADRWGLPTSIVDDLAIDALQCFLAGMRTGMAPEGSFSAQDVGWVDAADRRAPAVAVWMRARGLEPEERQKEHGMAHIDRVWRLWRTAFGEWYSKRAAQAHQFNIRIDKRAPELLVDWRNPLPPALHYVLGWNSEDADWFRVGVNVLGACGRDISAIFGMETQWQWRAWQLGSALGLGGNTAVIARSLAAAQAHAHGWEGALRWGGCVYNLRHGCFLGAVASGNLRVAQETFNQETDMQAPEIAARFGHVNVLRWLQTRGFSLEFVCEFAALCNQLDVLKWARAQVPPCPWSTYTCKYAASNGHLAVLQWLRAQDPPCPWDDTTCSAAAADNQLATLQWARAQDPPCPWSANTCRDAASNGHLAVLQWLRAQVPPCPWDARTALVAEVGHRTDVLAWALANGCPSE